MANDGKLVFIMILALIAFGIGAVAGISLGLNGFDDNVSDTNESNFTNVTVEMTSNVSQKANISFNPDIDKVDYNENITKNKT
ncbi:MAG: hypothetical protein HUK28_06160 [Methanobrevibacter sp.]|nr:hypothetical protein [Methanobrevibacter sp.]